MNPKLMFLVFFLGFKSFVFSQENIYWQHVVKQYPPSSAIVDVGYVEEGTQINRNVLTINLDGISYPDPSEFPGFLLPTQHQARTYQCWSLAASNQTSALAQVDLSYSAIGYHAMRKKILQMYDEQKLLYRDIEGGSWTDYLLVLQEYGAWPSSAFTSLPLLYNKGNFRPDHDRIMEMLHADFDPDETLELITVESALTLLDETYGVPPSTFVFDGQKYSPIAFAKTFGLNGNIIIPVVSRSKSTYWWWRGYDKDQRPDRQDIGLNLPPELLIDLMKYTVENGSGFTFEGDAYESFFCKYGQNLTVVPKWFCNWDNLLPYQKAGFRENGFYDGSTTPNHAYHIFSTIQKGGRTWFLARDSGMGAWFNPWLPNAGYWVHDATFLALKGYAYNIPRHTLIQFLSQPWVIEKYPKAAAMAEELEMTDVVKLLNRLQE